MYSYKKSLKSDISDELINTYALRPIAGFIVWALYGTSVTPNQVTIVSIITGLVAACFYLKATPEAFAIAGLFVTLKDLLDSADGQLARAKQQYSRVGRFLDSIGDFIVDVAVFSAIGWTLYQASGNLWMAVLSLFGLIGISLRVSYHVFYQVNYLHLQKLSANNRISEEIQEEDLKNAGVELVLQRIFQWIYGWQDRLMESADRWSSGGGFRRFSENISRDSFKDSFRESYQRRQGWYSDIISLRLSGLLGFGTELFLLMLCSVFNRLELYLYLNIFLMNGILILCVLYRRYVLLRNLRAIKQVEEN
jgi:phosphatidylglycerophosphate synthase